MKRKGLFKRADLAVIAVLLILAFALLLLRGGKGNVTAVITVDGETLHEIALADVAESYTIRLENGVTIGVSPAGVRFLSSDCRSKECVGCGELTRAGQAAACVPNRTLIVLRGALDKNAPDAISY